jgi:4-diphosphocytidyl-2-C-methyl-D-erythritol kinase
MLMQRVTLADRLTLQLESSPGVRIECAGVSLPPGGENIAERAARRMLQLAGTPTGVALHIDKRIPVAAGLGGGSSDAATVLLALNQLLGLDLSLPELIAEGLRLGADVPFFLLQHTAWATGVGECLQPVAGLPPVWYLLVNPGVEVSTAWVFQNLRLTSPGAVTKLPALPTSIEGLVDLLHNDLEPVTISRYPVVSRIKQQLLDSGALGALMSGSGPTVFGVFADAAAAQSAQSFLARQQGWRCLLVRPLAEGAAGANDFVDLVEN